MFALVCCSAASFSPFLPPWRLNAPVGFIFILSLSFYLPYLGQLTRKNAAPLGPRARPSQALKRGPGGLSPSANICPGSPGRSWRTRSSPWTEPSWRWRSGSRRRGWTGCRATRPPAPCWTAGTLRPSETARGGSSRAERRAGGLAARTRGAGGCFRGLAVLKQKRARELTIGARSESRVQRDAPGAL